MNEILKDIYHKFFIGNYKSVACGESSDFNYILRWIPDHNAAGFNLALHHGSSSDYAVFANLRSWQYNCTCADKGISTNEYR